MGAACVVALADVCVLPARGRMTLHLSPRLAEPSLNVRLA